MYQSKRCPPRSPPLSEQTTNLLPSLPSPCLTACSGRHTKCQPPPSVCASNMITPPPPGSYRRLTLPLPCPLVFPAPISLFQRSYSAPSSSRSYAPSSSYGGGRTSVVPVPVPMGGMGYGYGSPFGYSPFGGGVSFYGGGFGVNPVDLLVLGGVAYGVSQLMSVCVCCHPTYLVLCSVVSRAVVMPSVLVYDAICGMFFYGALKKWWWWWW